MAPTEPSPPPAPFQSIHPMITRGKSGIFKPRTFVGQAKSAHSFAEPTSVELALQHEGWKKAMIDELEALNRHYKKKCF